jgi:hypothetical protein
VYPTLGGGARVQFVRTYGDAAVCTQAAVVPDTVLRKDVKAAPTPPPVRDRINRVRHRGGEAGASRGYGGVQVQEVLVEKVEKAARVVGSQLNRLHSMAAQSGKRFDDLHIEMRSRTKVNREPRNTRYTRYRVRTCVDACFTGGLHPVESTDTTYTIQALRGRTRRSRHATCGFRNRSTA